MVAVAEMAGAYKDACAPVTLAALTGMARAEAGRLLWGHRWLWLHPADRHTRTLETPEDAVADALVRLGYGVEWWTGCGELMAGVEVFRSVLRRWAHELATVGRCSPLAGTEHLDRLGRGPSFRDWLDRRSGGAWAVFLVQDGAGHLCPVQGARILVDHDGQFERFGDAEVYRAFRVFPPPSAHGGLPT